MNAKVLLEHFERISNAPDAIARLRRFVLDLAVRGKLVEQDPSDEPASELLKRIAAEKARLVKAGEIRKPKSLRKIDDVPFELPTHWQWTRIREVTSDRGQQVPHSRFTYIDVTAIAKEAGIVAEPKILDASEAPSRARKITKKGDVIYSCVRPYLLNVAIIDTDFEPEAIASTAFAILNGHGLVLPRYLWIVLRSHFMVECVGKNQRGQAYPAINDADFASLPFPLPPLAEQHRIVAKVDELMSFCDQLEAAHQQQEQDRERLMAATLQRLNRPAEDPVTFRKEAKFALQVLPSISTTPAQIKQLRQTILNLAVRGKLLAGSMGQMAVVGDYRKLQNGYAFKSGWFTKTGIKLLRNTNIGHGQIQWDDIAYMPEERFSEFARFSLEDGDIVLTLDRPFIATGTKVARVNVCDLPALLLQRVGRFIEIAPGLDDDYLFLWINSPHFNDQIDPGRSNGVPHISSKQVEAASILIPSLAEQHRVVAKVDELMSLCDQLEQQLSQADQQRRRLLEVVLDQALAPMPAES